MTQNLAWMLVRMPARRGDRVSGYVHTCKNCKHYFIGRADAQYCCTSCRVLAHNKRKRKKQRT